MKRWLWYLAVIVAVAALSGKSASGTDVGKLNPVQAVRVYSIEDRIVIETDAENFGIGNTLNAALDDMKQTVPSEVFLDTADYLILSPSCQPLLPALMEHLRPSCAVCLEQGQTDVTQVGAFLEIHKPQVTLMRYCAGQTNLPTLITQNGRMELVS